MNLRVILGQGKQTSAFNSSLKVFVKPYAKLCFRWNFENICKTLFIGKSVWQYCSITGLDHWNQYKASDMPSKLIENKVLHKLHSSWWEDLRCRIYDKNLRDSAHNFGLMGATFKGKIHHFVDRNAEPFVDRNAEPNL